MSRYGFLVDAFLDALDLDVPLIPLQSPYEWMSKKRPGFSKKRYNDVVNKLRNRGFLKIVKKNNQKFIKITKNGELETLLRKAAIQRNGPWDGKWRVWAFDIPEQQRFKRDQLRLLLKRNNFIKLQASVFVSPYPVNREAILYLKQTGLIGFIRIMKVEEMDDDSQLKKKFALK